MEIYQNVAFYNQTRRQTRGSSCIQAASAEATRQQRPCWRHVRPLGEQTEGAGISVWATAVSLGHKAVLPWPEAGICQGHVKRTVTYLQTLCTGDALAGYVGGGGHDDSKQRGKQQRPQKSTRCRGGWCRSVGAPHSDLRAIKEGFLETVKPGLRQRDSQIFIFFF